MLKFFEYCFYRITYSKYYQRVDPKDPYVWAWGGISLSQTCNVLTFISIYCILNNTKYDLGYFWAIIWILTYLLNAFCFLTIKKYKELEKRDKNEKHRNLKGWGVFLYLFLSVVLFAFVAYKLFWVPKTWGAH